MFDQKLRHAIRLKGMTVEDFAKAMGVTRAGVYDMLKRKSIKPKTIEKICKVLGLQPNTEFGSKMK